LSIDVKVDGAKRATEDGRVIVGLLTIPDPRSSCAVRWSEATGMQVLVLRECAAHAQYISRNGDVVLGELFDPQRATAALVAAPE
jgi:hypothetical protein